MEALALRYRPQHFDDLVGQRVVQVFLQKMVTLDRVHHALLFSGSRGTGKTTSARILAAALNCENHPGPCGHCVSCKNVFNGTSPDVIEIDAASNGLVDDIRQLRQQVLYRVGGRYRVVIIDEAQSVSNAGFNALLKTIEEPPPGVVFLLLTTEPHRIPDTVASRCVPYAFRRLAVADIHTRLVQIAAAENLTVDDDLLRLLADRADGAMRDAIMQLDQVARVGIHTAEQYTALMGESDTGPALLNALLHGDTSATFDLLDEHLSRTADHTTIGASLIHTLRDILVLRSGGTLVKHGTALTARANLAERIDAPTAVAASKVLWDLKTRVRLDDARSSLELAIIMLGEILRPTPTNPKPVEPVAKLSLAQLTATQ